MALLLAIGLALSVLALGILCMLRSSSDPYGDFHLSLNKSASDRDSSPQTEWLNMGFWKDTTTFSRACQALALKLVEAARLERGDAVLDVGHGTGESLIFLLSHPSVPRPCHVTGITSLPYHSQRSRARLEAKGFQTMVDLHVGDAIWRAGSRTPDHPLMPSSEGRFETILALDCAYHFNPRLEFLRQAFWGLKPGGSIALADICFGPEAFQSSWSRFVIKTMRLMPASNVISGDQYVLQMRDIGFCEVQLEDITQNVFPGFCQFLKSRGLGWWVFGHVFAVYWRAGARFVIVRGTKPS